MSKAAVLMGPGFEESETMTIVDLLRRAGIDCTTFSLDQPYVEGMYRLILKADELFSEKIEEYDMLIVPGGRPGGENLKNDSRVIDMIRKFDKKGKLLAAMCSGTAVLAAANVIAGKKMTGYTGYAQKLTGAIFQEDVAILDQNLVSSQGPATAYPFAFKIMEAFGIDPSPYKERLLYNFAGGK